ncbi:hypothetical protein K1719_005537 [Acacia pycnantha]|nr:hypothetical protein K1719_005537 [Acacia pycnantha]
MKDLGKLNFFLGLEVARSTTVPAKIRRLGLRLVSLHFQNNWLCSPCLESLAPSFCRRLSSIMASGSCVTPNGNGNVSVSSPHNPQRTYQVVVAATRDLGIGRFDIATTEDVVICGSMSSASELLAASPYCLSIEKIFVIGGGQIFREALNAPCCEAIHITEIETSIECDAFLPPIDSSVFRPWYSSFPMVENNIRYSFTTYVRVRSSAANHLNQNADTNSDFISDSTKIGVNNFSFLPKMIFERHEEYMYLRLIQEIVSEGTSKDDRTGTGTLSKFGCQMRFNLRRSFPLLTTKALFWRGVVEELLWFISGSTNAKVLQEKGIHIWDGNASRGYLDSIGLTEREEGDLGPIYGFQWRHFGARYTGMHSDYSGQGFDQLLDVINKIKNNPDDRRIILSAWNPADLKLMALPPCHMFAQFYVANGELSCQLYQRSADMGLGVPFNIASYALLTCMIAHVCELVPGDFIHVIGDAHVYCNHVRPLQDQLQNQPRPFPVQRWIDSFAASAFELVAYNPHRKIQMKMAV